jgi:hypothetical protein
VPSPVTAAATAIETRDRLVATRGWFRHDNRVEGKRENTKNPWYGRFRGASCGVTRCLPAGTTTYATTGDVDVTRVKAKVLFKDSRHTPRVKSVTGGND